MKSLYILKKELEKMGYSNLFSQMKYVLDNNIPKDDPRNIRVFEQIKKRHDSL